MWKPTILHSTFCNLKWGDNLHETEISYNLNSHSTLYLYPSLRMILNKDNLHCRRAYFRSSLLSLRRERETTGNTSAVRRLKQNFEFPIPISLEVTTMSSVVPSLGTGHPIHPFVFPNFFPWLAHSCPQSPSFLGHVWLARRPTLGGSRWHAHKHRQIKWYISRLRLCVKLPPTTPLRQHFALSER